jgi:hypothetical protein
MPVDEDDLPDDWQTKPTVQVHVPWRRWDSVV